MTVTKLLTTIEGAYLLQPAVYEDNRGFFLESWNKNTFKELGINLEFVQDNHSRSHKNVLRGLHYQIGDAAQGKLVWVTAGEVFDVAVDLRQSSPTFGIWCGYKLCSKTHHRFFIPPGCAHGFLVLSDFADFQYKCTNFRDPTAERTLLWNDPTLNIGWPEITEETILNISDKDKIGETFESCDKYKLG